MTELEQSLVDAGYKKSVSGAYKAIMMTDTLYQKLISDRHGKRYFINAWYYAKDDVINFEAIQFEVQFKHCVQDYCVNVELSTNNIDMAEHEFSYIWDRMQYDYYELWENA